MNPQELLDILARAARLKVNTRHCDTDKDRKESVADHSWRLALMAMLMCLRVPGSMIIGILTVTVAGVLCGVTAMPEQAFSGFSLA